jgi:hypothetical protein
MPQCSGSSHVHSVYIGARSQLKLIISNVLMTFGVTQASDTLSYLLLYVNIFLEFVYS